MLRLVGTWTVVGLSAAPLPADPAHVPWLTFDGDGQVYGLAGVNRVRGTWSADGDTLTFGPFVSTLMAGPDDAMRVEQAVVSVLSEQVRLRAAGHADSAADPALDPAARGSQPLDAIELVGRDGTTLALTRGGPAEA